jgi:hypothetical protein
MNFVSGKIKVWRICSVWMNSMPILICYPNGLKMLSQLLLHLFFWVELLSRAISSLLIPLLFPKIVRSINYRIAN